LRDAHAKRCTRTLTLGTLIRANEPVGADSVSFSGRIGRRALSAGAYHAVLSASDAGGTSKLVTLGFTFVRGSRAPLTAPEDLVSQAKRYPHGLRADAHGPEGRSG
jgi:hypothetical protein